MKLIDDNLNRKSPNFIFYLSLVQSLKLSILSSTSFQLDKTFLGVGSAAIEQSRGKANMAAAGDFVG